MHTEATQTIQLAPAKRTYADLLIDYLLQIDVEYIFGVPGGAIEPLYDALARHQRAPVAKEIPHHNKVLTRRYRRSRNGPRAIIARHEAGAAFMADGYARETGRIGVCCATTGPGATNLITGVASAYADRVPMLVITPQTALPSFGKHGLQESSSDAIDTVGMFEECTRYNTLVSHEDQLEGKLFTALLTSQRKPRGPVHLSIPMDILSLPIGDRRPSFHVATLMRQPQVVDTDSMDALCEIVLSAKKIVLFLGAGARESIHQITEFAEHYNATIVTTPAGKCCVNPYHPLNRGVFGYAGHASARQALTDDSVDLVMAIGTSLGELSTSGWDQTALLNEKLVHIESTIENFSRSPMARLHVYGHMTSVFSELIDMHQSLTLREIKILGKQEAIIDKALLKEFSQTMADIATPENYHIPHNLELIDPSQSESNAVPIKPQRLMFDLVKYFPGNTRFLSDAGNSWGWTTHYLHPKQTGHYRIGLGYGAMAWAIGASVGTALGSPGNPVVCITGDGSFLMSGMELTVAVQHELPIIYVILNDQALGMVKHGQRLGGAEQIGYELPPVDFAGIARAVGAQAWTIRTPDDFKKLDFEAICNASVPTLLDVYIDPEEVPPMGVRMQTLSQKHPQHKDKNDWYTKD